MEKSETSDTDDASIKPVSSLRSLFENKQPLHHGYTANPPRPKTTVPSRLDSHGPVPRGSLDLPRLHSPWVSPGRTDHKPDERRSLHPAGEKTSADSPALRRSASVDSHTASKSPPLLTVQSPSSPPKPPPQLTFDINGRSPSKISSHSRSAGGSMPPPPPPQRGRNRLTSANASIPSPSPKPDDTQKMKPPPRPPSIAGSATNSKPAPPPVNRAEKPKTLQQGGKISESASLEPAPESRDKSVSPFSTPPSSDDELRKSKAKAATHQRQTSMQRESAHTHVSPPEIRKRTYQERPIPNKIPSGPVKKVDPRQLGFTQRDSRQDDQPEPPGLPLRPERDQSNEVRFRKPSNSPAPAPRLPARGPHQRNGSVNQPQYQSTFPPRQASISDTLSSENYPSSDANPLAARSMSRQDNGLPSDSRMESDDPATSNLEYPDTSNINRRPPKLLSGSSAFSNDYDARLVALCGQYVCTTGRSTRVWDVNANDMLANFVHGEREVKVTAVAFKAAAKTSDEGTYLWVGTNFGDLQEIDIQAESISRSLSGVHERREITAIHRHQTSMWTLDDSGRLCVWSGNASGLPSLHDDPEMMKVPRGQMVSIVIQDGLWIASGKEIRIFRPSLGKSPGFAVLQSPLSQPTLGAITTATIIDNQQDRVYFGHTDGKISIYSIFTYECLQVVNVSVYRVVSMVGIGPYLWAGYNTGMIYVYDTQSKPWTVKKEWLAHHSSPVLGISVDRSSLWKTAKMPVASIGTNNVVCLWDGTLEEDWHQNDMSEHDVEYCTFREMTALVVTWNAGAATPTHLRQDDNSAFSKILRDSQPPDLIVFGFQELVDLEDKKLTAKSLFKGTKKKDTGEQEHMSRQYRAWRDYLVRYIEDSMPPSEPYQLVHTSNMVGLFSCVFIKAALFSHIRGIDTAEIKRGMGGLHGNKGAIIIRFIYHDSSICLINCHLAAGQTQTMSRNNDVTSILDAVALPAEHDRHTRMDTYVCGGDGAMILDNEICILNGDLNYRIDTMSREVVVKAIGAANFSKLLERDQLLVSRRRNPGFRLLAFKESPITFAPTYKYDVGTDRYDTSEKRRVPAWCDRILYRGPGKIMQLDYGRYELHVSDHRPVTAHFKMRVKQIQADKRQKAWAQSEKRFQKVKEQLTKHAQISHLRDVLGVPVDEAERLV